MANCLNPKCKSEGKLIRGLCNTCYTFVKRYIKDGKTTWGELEIQGKALPKASSERRAWFGIK